MWTGLALTNAVAAEVTAPPSKTMFLLAGDPADIALCREAYDDADAAEDMTLVPLNVPDCAVAKLFMYTAVSGKSDPINLAFGEFA